MPLYALLPGTTPLSQFPVLLAAQHDAMRSLERGTTAPTLPVNGLLWNRTDAPTIGEAIYRYNGTSFVLLMDPEYAQINAGGTVTFAADQPMGTFKFTGLGAGTAAGHSVRFEQVVLVNGANAMTGALNMGSQKITSLAAGTDPSDAARLSQTTPSGMGRFRFLSGVTLAQQVDDAGTFIEIPGENDVPFTPRILHLRLTGEVRDQSDNDLHGTIDKEYTVRRWAADPGSLTIDASVTVGIRTVRVGVEWKTTSPRGVWVRVIRNDNDEYQNVQNVELMAIGGVAS
jgi:hypothetical protein